MKFPQILRNNEGTSDKVYIVEVNKLGPNYVTTTTYGPRNANILNTRIIYNGDSHWEATWEGEKIVNQKIKGKYKPYDGHIAGYDRKDTPVSTTLLTKTETKEEIKTSAPKARKITL